MRSFLGAKMAPQTTIKLGPRLGWAPPGPQTRSRTRFFRYLEHWKLILDALLSPHARVGGFFL